MRYPTHFLHLDCSDEVALMHEGVKNDYSVREELFELKSPV
jgi:hypothetical protein